jgi:hypothetical protein
MQIQLTLPRRLETMDGMRQGVFWAIVVAVGANALLGCLALIFGDLDDDGPTTAARILMTSFSITVAGFVGLPSALAAGEKRYVLGMLGLLSCIAAEVLILGAVWEYGRSDGYFRALVSLVLIAGALAIANLLWTAGFSWGRHSMRRAALLWLAASTPLSVAIVWAADDADLAGKLGTTVVVLAPTAALGGLLWNDRFHLLRNVVRAGWIVWLAIISGVTLYALWRDEGELWTHVAASALVLVVTLGHYSLVMMAKLSRRFVIVKAAAIAANLLASGVVLYAIWAETFGDNLARATGALVVLTAAFTVLVPVFQRQSGPQAGRPDRTSFCPHCGAFLNLEPGDGRCDTCGARFRVEFRRSRLVTRPVATSEPLQRVE